MIRAAVLGGALALLCSTASAGAQRPPGAPGGDTVAEVHLRIGGGSKLRAGGKEYAATPGTALLRNDELIVPAGQVLVVKLRNGYLIRLDDDINLFVAKIVLLDAPRTSESIGSQLDRLLTKEEQGRAERIAGSHAQIHGAQTGDLSSSTPRQEPRNTKDATGNGEGGGGGAPERERPAQAPPPVRAGDAAPLGEATTPIAKAPSPPEPSNDKPNNRSADEPSGRNKAKKIEAQAPLANPALRSCLATELGKLPIKLKKAPLRLFIRGGQIERAQLGGGLSLPECARPLLIGRPSDGAEGRWLVVELPLR